MNSKTPKEIVRALRAYADNAQENFEVDSTQDFDAAVDLIESLQAQLAAGKEANDICHEYIASLKEQLAASQRRERAAVEDWKIYEENGQCDVCKYGEGGGCAYPEGNRCHFEWRGPRDAGKGDSSCIKHRES